MDENDPEKTPTKPVFAIDKSEALSRSDAPIILPPPADAPPIGEAQMLAQQGHTCVTCGTVTTENRCAVCGTQLIDDP